jgi:hypothetical protein
MAFVNNKNEYIELNLDDIFLIGVNISGKTFEADEYFVYIFEFSYNASLIDETRKDLIPFFSSKIYLLKDQNRHHDIIRYCDDSVLDKFINSDIADNKDFTEYKTIGLTYLSKVLPYSSSAYIDIEGNFLHGNKRQFTLLTKQTKQEIYYDTNFHDWFAKIIKENSY